MSRDESSADLRTLIRGTAGTPGSGDDIANIVSSELPDGAQCFVISNRTNYRFRKHSTLAASGTAVIAPIAGGGRWVQEGAPAGAIGLFVAATGENNIDSSASSDWLPAITAEFALQAGTGLWAFNPASCIATYNGPAARYLCEVIATLALGAGESANIVIALNDDITGTEAAFAEGEQFLDFATDAEKTVVMQAQRFVTLAPGDNIRPKFRVGNAETDTPIERLTLSAWAIA